MPASAFPIASARVPERPPSFAISSRALPDGGLLLAPSGELDLGTVDQLARALADAGRERRAVELDLGALGFIDSTGLALLIETAASARADGWPLRLVDPSPAVARIVELTQTHSALGLDAAEPEGD